MNTRVKTATEILAMRESGRMLATILNQLQADVEADMSTKDVAIMANRQLKLLGGQAPFLGYQGFPDVICISLNDEVVHGIPKPDRIIHSGDLVSLDFGVNYRGMITDSAITFIVGKTTKQSHQDLVKYTKESLMAGISVVHDRVRVGDIGSAVEAVLDHRHYGIVRDLVGHGVGHQLHEDPNIPNYGRANSGPWLQKGMTIAIEPMATLGTDRVVQEADHWTIRTLDHSMSAHFEHSILITEEGSEILTTL